MARMSSIPMITPIWRQNAADQPAPQGHSFPPDQALPLRRGVLVGLGGRVDGQVADATSDAQLVGDRPDDRDDDRVPRRADRAGAAEVLAADRGDDEDGDQVAHEPDADTD